VCAYRHSGMTYCDGTMRQKRVGMSLLEEGAYPVQGRGWTFRQRLTGAPTAGPMSYHSPPGARRTWGRFEALATFEGRQSLPVVHCLPGGGNLSDCLLAAYVMHTGDF
jgi:hypothetical protein